MKSMSLRVIFTDRTSDIRFCPFVLRPGTEAVAKVSSIQLVTVTTSRAQFTIWDR